MTRLPKILFVCSAMLLTGALLKDRGVFPILSDTLGLMGLMGTLLSPAYALLMAFEEDWRK